MIKLTGLNKHYGNHHALCGIDLTIEAGEIFGIIGRSGAGKSTLLRCINMLERPDSGTVLVDNQNMLTLSPHALREARHHIGMIFQHFNLLLAKTVYENIALPLRIQGVSNDTIEKRVTELLTLVELSDKAHAYPAALSGGQKQRVAIARALSSAPNILLCDEATSALDPETTTAILALLKKINHDYGITIILITHEMDVVKQLAHRVALMEKGRITEIIALNTLFSKPSTPAKKLLCAQLSPELPPCISKNLTQVLNNRPLLRIFFQGEAVNGPIISQISRELHLNINILLANVDRIDGVTCGVVVVELEASPADLQVFLKHCEPFHLIVETLGYVTNDDL
ncbi:MAG: ATP-binding cassette domain-containing protein [Gammaproteobacteria bacterium]|nr:ATP-binding cassette domain-containing protein [Gammaproteobacteria bacterium]